MYADNLTGANKQSFLSPFDFNFLKIFLLIEGLR